MIDLLKNYLEKRIQLVKVELIASFANIASGLISSLLVLLFVFFIILILSFALAFWLGDVLENTALGFLSTGGIYALLFIGYLTIGKTKMDATVKDTIVKNAMKNEELTSDTIEEL